MRTKFCCDSQIAPEQAACEARKCLRELLTKEERGEAINAVGQLIGRFPEAAHKAGQGEA